MKTCKELIALRKKLWEKTKDIDKDYQLRQSILEEIKESKVLINELRQNPHLLMELQFTVIDKEFNEVPFFLNVVQRDFQDDVLVPQIREQEEGVRDQIKIKILKGRQQGFTTYITAFQLCLALTQVNFQGFTMAHDQPSTESIFDDIAKGFYERLIDDLFLKNNTKKSNAKEFILDGPNSSWRIATAGSKKAGRGKKLRMLHNSEKAFWEDMRKNELATSQALTPTRSIEIDETTANGYNEFQEDWEEIERGHSKWDGVFYEWFRTSEYRKKFSDVQYSEKEFLKAVNFGERFYGVDTKFMLKLKGLLKNGLDILQIHWYFDKRRVLKDKLPQEYPCTPKEAFLHSGRPHFDIELLDILIQEFQEKEFQSLKGGEFEIFEQPKPDRRYIIGSDVSEGLEERDSSTFCILDADSLEEVANAEYIRKPEQHGRILADWGRKYNNAYIGVERNNHGHSTLNTLINEIKYKRLHIEKTVDKKHNKTTNKPGWSTNPKSKYLMLDELDSFIREEKITIRSIRTLNEMRGVQNKNGKIETNGKDRTIAVAIALQMRKHIGKKDKSTSATWR